MAERIPVGSLRPRTCPTIGTRLSLTNRRVGLATACPKLRMASGTSHRVPPGPDQKAAGLPGSNPPWMPSLRPTKWVKRWSKGPNSGNPGVDCGGQADHLTSSLRHLWTSRTQINLLCPGKTKGIQRCQDISARCERLVSHPWKSPSSTQGLLTNPAIDFQDFWVSILPRWTRTQLGRVLPAGSPDEPRPLAVSAAMRGA